MSGWKTGDVSLGPKSIVADSLGLWTSCCECGRTFKRAARSFPRAQGLFVNSLSSNSGIRKTQLSSLVCLGRPKSNGGWWFGTFYIFPFSWECHHPNWLFTPSFFRGVGTPPTRNPMSSCQLKWPFLEADLLLPQERMLELEKEWHAQCKAMSDAVGILVFFQFRLQHLLFISISALSPKWREFFNSETSIPRLPRSQWHHKFSGEIESFWCTKEERKKEKLPQNIDIHTLKQVLEYAQDHAKHDRVRVSFQSCWFVMEGNHWFGCWYFFGMTLDLGFNGGEAEWTEWTMASLHHDGTLQRSARRYSPL